MLMPHPRNSAISEYHALKAVFGDAMPPVSANNVA
jgi:hypothetical protein